MAGSAQYLTRVILDKIADAIDDINDVDDEDSDEAVEPPKGTDAPLAAFSHADLQEITSKIINIDPSKLPAIVEIIGKFEKINAGEEIEIDIEKCSNKTLHALQEFLGTGIVPGMSYIIEPQSTS